MRGDALPPCHDGQVRVDAVRGTEPGAVPSNGHDLATPLSVPSLLAVSLSASLAACGGDADDGQVATDTAPTTPTATAEPTPSGPTVAPEAGSLPDYPYADYAYTLEMRCYCANQDQKYRITVAGGEVTDVTWATDGDGHAVGDAGQRRVRRVTIQDVIDQGNDPKAAQVDVEWPAGQDCTRPASTSTRTRWSPTRRSPG